MSEPPERTPRDSQSEFDGRVRVERYALGRQPGKVMQQPEVVARLKAQGVTVLPITVVEPPAGDLLR